MRLGVFCIENAPTLSVATTVTIRNWIVSNCNSSRPVATGSVRVATKSVRVATGLCPVAISSV